MLEIKFKIMKNILIIFFLGLIISSCSSVNGLAKDNSNGLISDGSFTFSALKANPTNIDVINVMNNFPGSSSSQMLNLSGDDTAYFSSDSINVDLPYFGRVYNPNPNPKKNGLHFTSKKFSFDSSKSTSKKQVLIYTIEDVNYIDKIYVECFKNGKAYLSINANDRQSISYDGRVSTVSK